MTSLKVSIAILALVFAALWPALAAAMEDLPTITITGIASDETYGYTEGNPIKVGGLSPARERAYLDLLRGANGEAIRYERRGSCCGFETPNGLLGGGMLDIYSVWIGDDPKPLTLYINMYDYEQPKAPKGFTFAGAV